MSQSKIFVIGDTHFLHDNIIEYTGRPGDFNTRIIRNWNKVVSDNDMVFHLGDLSAGVKGRYDLLAKMCQSLKGQRILIRGNHDHYSDEFYKNECGFEDVVDHIVIDDLLFCHYPLRITKYSKPNEIEWVEKLQSIVENQGIKKIIHGHVHNRDSGIKDHYNCSVEVIDYTPQELNEFLKEK